MYGFICWCVAFPLALAAEALCIIAALDQFADDQPRPDLLLVAALMSLFAVSAVVIGYVLRRAI